MLKKIFSCHCHTCITIDICLYYSESVVPNIAALEEQTQEIQHLFDTLAVTDLLDASEMGSANTASACGGATNCTEASDQLCSSGTSNCVEAKFGGDKDREAKSSEASSGAAKSGEASSCEPNSGAPSS